MREQEEIQRAHDILWSVVMEELVIFPDDVAKAARISLDVLCWLLQHEHNVVFADNLAMIEKIFDEAGYVIVRDTDGGDVRHNDAEAQA